MDSSPLGADRRPPEFSFDRLAAQLRLGIARHRWMRHAVVVAAVAASAWSWWALSDERRAAIDAWGESVDVWVAEVSVSPGDSVRASAASMPVAAVPSTRVRGDPSGQVATQHVAAGEVVVAHDVTTPDGPRSLAPPGTTVVAIADPLVSVASTGASIVVASEGVVLASAGIVTSVSDGVVHVAVPDDAAAVVAFAASQHRASLLFPSSRSHGG